MRLRTLFLSVFLFGVGCDKIYYGERTTYSSGFSEWEFRRLEKGAPLRNVVLKLGPPLRQTTQHWAEVWQFSKTPTFRKTPTGLELENFGPLLEVSFSSNGVANSATTALGGTNLLGLSKTELREKLGDPFEVTITEFRVIYHYAGPVNPNGKWGTYKIREVHFDTNMQVVTNIADVRYDP